MAKIHHCKGCGKEMSESEYSETRCYMSVLVGLCSSCHTRTATAMDNATDKYRRGLEASGRFSSSEIENMVYKYRQSRFG